MRTGCICLGCPAISLNGFTRDVSWSLEVRELFLHGFVVQHDFVRHTFFVCLCLKRIYIHMTIGRRSSVRDKYIRYDFGVSDTLHKLI